MRAVAPQTTFPPTSKVWTSCTMPNASRCIDPMTSRREEVGDGELDQPGHLVGLGDVGVRIWHDAHPRRQAEPGRHHQRLAEPSQHLHVGGSEADLLLGLAQRGGLGVGVGRIDPAPREGDLPGVEPEVVAPPRHEDVGLAAPA